MARLEAHFRSRATLEKGKKQIRAANAILNPHGIWADRKRVSNHKPRKGTETHNLFFINADYGNKFQITNPARGRKPGVNYTNMALYESFKSQTPQGDGNFFSSENETERMMLVSNHKPRKGTETPVRRRCSPRAGRAFQITNPARGRKPPHPKHRTHHVAKRFKSQTPQGDGNVPSFLTICDGCGCVSNHKPRKGTETS